MVPDKLLLKRRVPDDTNCGKQKERGEWFLVIDFLEARVPQIWELAELGRNGASEVIAREIKGSMRGEIPEHRRDGAV
ncbi:hypothetical protein SUGI_0562250 [Cryptomeria japonica]|nr:hypothetical protein SUGI_0562250 [Cryptomeria japonica]